MKRMKRVLAGMLSLVLWMPSLFACDSGSEKNNGTTDSSVGSETDTVTTEGGEDPVYEQKGVFLNIDVNTVTFPFLNEIIRKETVTEEDLYVFVDQYADTQITDLALNVFCQVSMTPTAVLTHIVDQCEKTEVNGTAVDFFKATEGVYSLCGIYEIFKTHGIDPYEVWFKRASEKGMTTWLSVRMNDCHEPGQISWLHGDLYYEAVEKGWTIGGGGYNRFCLDFAVPEVRTYMLDYIREQLLHYDVGGLELDFSREWYCFKNDGKDHTAIMNAYLREISAVVKEAETKWGHDIKISIRLMRDMEQNKAFGFDAFTMANEKLVDSITVCPRWGSNDSDMPIAEWKEALTGVEIYAGITDLTYNKGTTYQLVAGYAAQYLQQGADKIYLYNFFNNPLAPNEGYAKMYTTCGSLATLEGEAQRYVVTYQDTTPSGYTAWNPLPATLNGFSLEVATGPVDEKDVVWIVVGLDQKIKRADITITVNGHAVDFKSMTQFANTYTNANQYRFKVPAEYCDPQGHQTIAMTSGNETLQLKYLEMTIGVRMG